MKVFISQPMKGRSEADIRDVRNMAATMADIFCAEFEEETEILDSYISNVPKGGTMPLRFLARSLDLLAQADVVIFTPGWESARGCRIEELCAKEYGIKYLLYMRPDGMDARILLHTHDTHGEPVGERGAEGKSRPPIGICPVCGARQVRWDPHKDRCFCCVCGWRE